MKKIITLSLLGFFSQLSSSFSQEVIEAKKVIQEYAEKATVSVETVEMGEGYSDETKVFTLTSTELKISGKSIHKKVGHLDLAFETVLFKIKKIESWHQGQDGRNVKLIIDSYVFAGGFFSKKISTIETRGHKFANDPHSHKIYITQYGCCGGPTEVHTFDITTGKELPPE